MRKPTVRKRALSLLGTTDNAANLPRWARRALHIQGPGLNPPAKIPQRYQKAAARMVILMHRAMRKGSKGYKHSGTTHAQPNQSFPRLRRLARRIAEASRIGNR